MRSLAPQWWPTARGRSTRSKSPTSSRCSTPSRTSAPASIAPSRSRFHSACARHLACSRKPRTLRSKLLFFGQDATRRFEDLLHRRRNLRGHTLLLICPFDPLSDNAIAVDHQIRREGVYGKRFFDRTICVAIMGPIHVLLGDEVSPFVIVIIGAHAYQ